MGSVGLAVRFTSDVIFTLDATCPRGVWLIGIRFGRCTAMEASSCSIILAKGEEGCASVVEVFGSDRSGDEDDGLLLFPTVPPSLEVDEKDPTGNGGARLRTRTFLLVDGANL